MTDPKPTMSTTEAGELLGLCAKTVAALWRSGDLQGYATPTRHARRVHKIRIYTDSVADYQQKAEQTPLKTASRGF